MAGIQYDMVQENDPYYKLVRGDFFANFDTFKEFKYQIDKSFPTLWNLEEISRRENGLRAESLIKCTFNISKSSHHPFYIYLCQIEGGGRKHMPYEQRIQFREHTKWMPDLNTFNIANKFHDITDADNAECYLIGIYKRSEKDHDVMFIGIHPNWMYDKRIESESTSPTSFQVKIYPIQEAYKSGQAIFTKEDGQRAICFKPNKILWCMENRDKLHLEDINKVKKMMVNKFTPVYGSRQVIYYGAPGTGKSHIIKKDTKGEEVIRTTFHPDTDYSTFVGAYKPTTIEKDVMTVIDAKAVPVKDEDGKVQTESKIIYEFVPQAFLQAYVKAWKFYSEATVGDPEKQYLIIEEINRGNCAQIFGDLFQLLDRNEAGFSEYPISADADMKRHLQKYFKNLEILEKDSINALYDGRNVVEEVLNGEILLLPSNLYIWATMNTSDQSLFPIDSAFKRRWDWKYMPISNGEKGWVIEADKKKYDWWQFLCAINEKIGSTTSSEDKKLGYFFCKADSKGIISADRFVGKVVFYIWNDIFKDYEFADKIFNDPEGGKLSFDKFYTAEGENAKVIEKKVISFLTNLELKPIEDNVDPIDSDISKFGLKIKVNDIEVKNFNAIPYTAVEEYVKLNPEKSAEEVVSIWGKFVSCNPTSWFIVTDEGRQSLSERYAGYCYEIKCADGRSVWVNKDGWRRGTDKNPRDTVQEFIDAVNTEDLGIHIEEIKQ